MDESEFVTIIGDASQKNNVAVLLCHSTCDRCSKITNKTLQYKCEKCGEIYALLEEVRSHYYSEHTTEIGVICNLDIQSPDSLVSTESPFPDEFSFHEESTSKNIEAPVIEKIAIGREPSTVKRPIQRIVKKVTKYGKELVSVPKINDWFTNCYQLRTPYYPQIGDEVHISISAYKNFEEQLIKSLGSLIKPQVFENSENVAAVVFNIEFVERNVDLFQFIIYLSLKVIGSDTNIHLWWCNKPVPDFIVLAKNDKPDKWLVGDEIRVLANQCWWMGTITKYNGPNNAGIQTWFHSLEVSYPQSDEPELVSPWDLFEVNTTRKPNKRNGGVCLYTDELHLLQYLPDVNEWPNYGKDCKRLAKGLQKVLNTRIGNLFKDANADTVHQMKLNVIVNRLEKQFYRRIQSVQFDLQLIKESVEKWCLNTTSKQKANTVLEIIKQFIDKSDCRDISQLLTSSLSANDIEVMLENSFQVTKRSKRKRQVSELENRNEAADLSFIWREDCLKLIDGLCEEQFAIPFIKPVDLVEYPDYTKYIVDPIDLETIRNRLQTLQYSKPENMEKDLRLLISNSRHYNLDKTSRLYKCTTYLEQHVNEKMAIIIRDYFDTHRREKKPKQRE